MAGGILEQIVAGEAPPLVPLTVEQYHRLTETGVLPEGSPIELIDGFLIYKDRGDARSSSPMVQGPFHALAVNKLMRTVSRQVEPTGLLAWCQLPIFLPPRHEPEPDVSIIEGPATRYSGRLPEAREALAVMEVGHSSRSFDRGTKQRVYAEANIPLFAFVDLAQNTIEVYTEPVPDKGHYHRCETYSAGETVLLELRSGIRVEFTVDEILTRE